jgi:hypothetical protein
MKTTLMTFAIAAALGALAGCDRDTEQRSPTTATPTPAPQAGAGASSAREATTPSTPANTDNAKSEGKQPPVQGREDVRQPEQQKDFQMKGDAAGPKPGG